MKKLGALMIVLLILMTNLIVSFGEQLNIDSSSYILIDSKSGQVLYEHNADARRYPASTTKMLTAIVALENAELDRMMTASLEAVNDIGKDGMNIGIMAGEQIDLEHLLKALMISSANETANIIAENISGTRKGFMDLMNKRAAEIGAVNTHFTNPCGAHEKDHYTTARDLAAIARHGMTNPKFRELAKGKTYRMLPTNKHDEWPVLASTNKLLGTGSDYYSEVIGIKTGYTDPAGNNLASAAVDETGMELIAVVMDVGPNAGRHAIFRFSKELLDYGFKNFAIKKLQSENEVIRTVNVQNAKDGLPLEIIAQNGFEYVLPKDINKQNVTAEIKITPEITAPIRQGEILGEIQFKRNDAIIGIVNLTAARSVEEKPVAARVLQGTVANPAVTYPVIITGIVLASFIVLRYTLRRISRKLNSRKSRLY